MQVLRFRVMNHRHGWRVGIAVLGAAGMVDALHVGCLGARAGDGAPAWARPPAVTRLQPGAGQMLGDLQGAVWMGWLRDPKAVVEGTPVSTWLVRLVSNDPAETVAARRVLTSLGRGALPWLAIGLGEHAGERPGVSASLTPPWARLPPREDDDRTRFSPWRRRGGGPPSRGRRPSRPRA